jgi:DNA-directed RNA polymerase subunit beta'
LASKAAPLPDSPTWTFDKTAKSFEQVLNQVCNHEIRITDNCIFGGVKTTIGRVAIKACLTKYYGDYRLGVLPLTTDPSVQEKPTKESWYKALIQMIAMGEGGENGGAKQSNRKPKSTFIDVVNNLVKLGFAVANINPPDISVLDDIDIKPLIKKFHESIKEREEMYNRGFETLDVYSAFYADKYSSLEKEIRAYLATALGSENGYISMVESGARGSWSNVSQCFGLKGRVMKNARESFNAILEHSMAEQLTGLEHFVSAFGARQGISDKVIATAEPGYQSRKMEHAANITSIVSKDCYTEEGMPIDYDVIEQFIPHHMLGNDPTADIRQVRDYFISIVVGRYIVGLKPMVKDEQMAGEIFDENVATIENGAVKRLGPVFLRSPLFCEKPCCAKCYGIDLGTQREAVDGTPIGSIAAQSIGEPGTQLTMKKFQRGGVAGVTDLTSSFELVKKYTHIESLQTTSADKHGTGVINYDYISPVEGHVKTVSLGNGTKRLRIMRYNANGTESNVLNKTIILREDVELKDYVKRGDSIQKHQGYLSIKEMLPTRGAEESIRYLVFMLYNIFKSETFVNFKHFETLATGMFYHVCLKGNNHFGTGKYYTLQEYYANDHSGAEFTTTIEGIGSTVHMRNDLLSSVFFEDMRTGLVRSMVVSGRDSLTNPLVRTTLGLRLGIGSDVPNYVDLRGNV